MRLLGKGEGSSFRPAGTGFEMTTDQRSGISMAAVEVSVWGRGPVSNNMAKWLSKEDCAMYKEQVMATRAEFGESCTNFRNAPANRTGSWL